MNVLLLLPPTVNGNWVRREQKAAGYTINPHNPYLALQIAGHLRERVPGITLHVIDAQVENLDFETLTRKIQALSPALIICLMSAYFLPTDRLCAELDYPTIGVMCPSSIDLKEAIDLYHLKTPYFTTKDPINTTVEAVGEFREKGEVRDTPGMVIQKDGRIISTGEPAFRFPEKHVMPAFDLFPMKKYLSAGGGAWGLISPQEGCPFQCTFCTKGRDKTIYYMDARGIAEELKVMHEEYGYDHFHFCFSEASANKKHLHDLCRHIIDSGIKIRWLTNDRVDLVNRESLEIMKRAGCYEICYGIESGDQELLDSINKRLDLTKVEPAFATVKSVGIAISAYMMIGIPGETKASLQKGIDLIRRIDPDNIYVAFFFPAPCSQAYYDLKAQGRLLVEDWSLYRERTRLLFRHDYYKSIGELMSHYRWYYRHFLRIVYRNKARNSRNLMVKLIYRTAYLSSFVGPVHDLIYIAYENRLLRDMMMKIHYYSD